MTCSQSKLTLRAAFFRRIRVRVLTIEPELEATGHAALEVELALVARGTEMRVGDGEPRELNPLQQAPRRECLGRSVAMKRFFVTAFRSNGRCRFFRGGVQNRLCACRAMIGTLDWSAATRSTRPTHGVSRAAAFVWLVDFPWYRLTWVGT